MNLADIHPPNPAELEKASGVAKAAANDWQWYTGSCRKSADLIMQILEQEVPNGVAGKQGLDWGSALGGVAFEIQCGANVKMTAADVDGNSIRWIRENIPSLAAEYLIPEQPLPFEDGRFDFVYGLSVLTHIPSNLQEYYVNELFRISTKDALLILTVMSYRAIDHAVKTGKDPILHPQNHNSLDEVGLHFRTYPQPVLDGIEFTRKTNYGVAYHSASYIDGLFGSRFDRVDNNDIALAHQDVLVLRKK